MKIFKSIANALTPKPNPDDAAWERVLGRLYRTPCPGGWIYCKFIPGHSVAITFVPTPQKGKKK